MEKNTLIKTSFLTILLFLLGWKVVYSQNNIALHKPCSFYPKANYPLTNGKNDSSFLTDGIYSSIKGSIWVDPKTLGWTHVSEVSIHTDLGKIYSVGSITLNTAYNATVGANLPQNLFVFTSINDSDYFLNGDMMKNISQKNGVNVLKLKLDNLNAKCRYILIKAIPNGAYFFTDEIEVFEAPDKRLQTVEKNTNLGRGPIFRRNNIDEFVKKNSGQKIIRNFLDQYIQAAKMINNTGIFNTNLIGIENEIATRNDLNDSSLESYKYQLMALTTENSTRNELLVKNIHPFSEDFSLIENPLLYKLANKDTTLTIISGGTEYAGFSVYNEGKNKEMFRLSFSGDSRLSTMNIFNEKFITTRDFKIIPDALIQVSSDEAIQVYPGETKFYLVRITGKKAGFENRMISIKSKTNSYNLNYGVTINKILLNAANLKMNAIVWAYFNYLLLIHRESSAQRDLLAHHINTMVIPPGALSFGNPLGVKSILGGYLDNCFGFKNILLFVNLAGKVNSPGFFSDKWKASFLGWYDTAIASLQAKGFKNNYLYLFDEISNEDIPSFNRIVLWLKQVRQSVKFYGTVNSDKDLSQLLPVLDIIQLVNRNNIPIESITKENKWIYDSRQPEKSQLPYSFFRLMAWDAYAKGCNGIGFWDYADVGRVKNETSVWNDFDGVAPDYSVVYDLNDQIISSRRWEAFKLGIEDYELLIKYESKYGKKATLQICKEVLLNSSDESLSDKVKLKIINSL